MRKHLLTSSRPTIVVAAVSLLVLASCESRQDSPVSDALADFAARYADAWSGQDPAALASFYAANGVLIVNDGDPSVGRDAVEQTAAAFMTGFPDMAVRLVDLRWQDGRVVFRWHWTGTNTGPGGTGNPVDIEGYEVWTLDSEGRILESRGYFDEAEYQRQVNAEKAAP